MSPIGWPFTIRKGYCPLEIEVDFLVIAFSGSFVKAFTLCEELKLTVQTILWVFSSFPVIINSHPSFGPLPPLKYLSWLNPEE
jgi:hypothetical protein